jgi:hypothetical protein
MFRQSDDMLTELVEHSGASGKDAGQGFERKVLKTSKMHGSRTKQKRRRVVINVRVVHNP